MTSKLTSEILDDETLAELIAFRRSRVEYCQKEGLPYQKALHDSMMLALEELQERRKADRESVAEVLSNRPGNGTSIVDVALPVGTQLYRHAQPAPASMGDHQIRELVNELRDISIECHGTQQLRERIARTVRAAMLNGGKS